MDWVEKRAHEDRLLQTQTLRVWEHLCIAIEHAVKSFLSNYDPVRVAYSRQYTDHVLVARQPAMAGEVRLSVEVVLDANKTHIGVTHQGLDRETIELRFAVADGTVVLQQQDGKVLTEEEASRLVLEKVLFPPDPFVRSFVKSASAS